MSSRPSWSFLNNLSSCVVSTALNPATMALNFTDGLIRPHIQRWIPTMIDLESYLPYVHILPISTKFICESTNQHYSIPNLLTAWLRKDYTKTVADCKKADYYFAPSTTRDCLNTPKLPSHRNDLFEYANLWWTPLEKEITGFAVVCPAFSLDRVFIEASFPHDHPPLSPDHPSPQLRDIMDVRFLRSDNTLTTNGRDVRIPFLIDQKYAGTYVFDPTDYKPRKLFLLVTCNDSWEDRDRAWCTHAFNMLNYMDIQNAFISVKVEEPLFAESVLTSDFCFILPGDYPIVWTMYQALLSGCIPVLFLSFQSELPFHELLDWSKFSVVVLKDILRSMDDVAVLTVGYS